NLLVPYEDRETIDNKECNHFRILSSMKNRSNSDRFYAIETTEEEFTYLTLKYGSNKVWKR
ncbi:MAG TPA: hypothetical protein VIY47_03415, partial [Ignavibacteriaceae bacterium]